ncbi:hypothetical protein E2C01_100335 [Portunus trituberculatus]|uniref:Uncharacterized protein n=1 Tax=Portunus trituberculatus TaxID=210409 RepID=A0A5B7KDC2_PORTR|nr:hypothetical protein [Portunus trituberculatus]
MRGRRKLCAVKPLEEGKHAVSNINTIVNMKIVIKDRKRCNISAVRKKLKTVTHCVSESPSKHTKNTPYRGGLGPCTELAVRGVRKTGGDTSERLTS